MWLITVDLLEGYYLGKEYQINIHFVCFFSSVIIKNYLYLGIFLKILL